MKNPLVLPLLALAAGILVSQLLVLELGSLALALAAAVVLALLARWRARRLALTCCLLMATLAGAMLEAAHRPGRPPEIDAGAREVVLLNGCVVSPPAFYEGRDQFTVELAPKARAQVSMIIRDGETPPDLHYGQRVEFEARIRPTRNFQNPGAFDYEAYLARSNIYWTASVPAGAGLTVVPGRCGSRFLAAIFALRTAALNRIERLYAGNPYATGMMEATLIGETRKLESIWTHHFRRTGTYHMLVIDGLHITVLAAFLLFLLRLCFVPEMSALALTAAGAWLYALVSGWNAPAVRAAGGFTLYVVARYFYRRGRFLNLLAAAASRVPDRRSWPAVRVWFPVVLLGRGRDRRAGRAGARRHFVPLCARPLRYRRTKPRSPPRAACRTVSPGAAAARRDSARLPENSRNVAAPRAGGRRASPFLRLRNCRDLHRDPNRRRSADGALLPPHLADRVVGQYLGGPAAGVGCSRRVRRCLHGLACSRGPGSVAFECRSESRGLAPAL